MAKIAPKPMKPEKEPLEIIVSHYWPTTLLKSVKITIPGKDSWHNDITLTKSEAQYLHQHLTDILKAPQTIDK